MTEDHPRYDIQSTPPAGAHEMEPVGEILRRLIDERNWQHLLPDTPSTRNGSPNHPGRP